MLKGVIGKAVSICGLTTRKTTLIKEVTKELLPLCGKVTGKGNSVKGCNRK